MNLKSMVTKFLGRAEKSPTQTEVNEWAGTRIDARDIAKGFIVAKEGHDPFGSSSLILRFQYNPGQLTAQKSLNYGITEIPGSPNPLVEFLSGKETKWTFELLFHVPTQYELDYVLNVSETEKRHIETYGFVDFQIKKFGALTSSRARFQPPPFIEVFFPGVTSRQIMSWDATVEQPRNPIRTESLLMLSQTTNGMKIGGVITDYKVQLTQFDRFMRPTSAKVDITIVRAAPVAIRSSGSTAKKTQSSEEKVKAPEEFSGQYFEASVEYLESKYNVGSWEHLRKALGGGTKELYHVKQMNSWRVKNLGPGLLRDSIEGAKRGIIKLPAKARFANEAGLKQWTPEAIDPARYEVNTRTHTLAGLPYKAERKVHPYIAVSPGPWEDVKLELQQ